MKTPRTVALIVFVKNAAGVLARDRAAESK
jgi:hypothetical protein